MLDQTELFAFVAVALALALVGAIAVQAIMVAQSADAAGCRTSVAVNASKGRCIVTRV